VVLPFVSRIQQLAVKWVCEVRCVAIETAGFCSARESMKAATSM
jgi:hypothetical protein